MSRKIISDISTNISKRLNINKKVGLPPGSVVFTGEKKVEDVLVHFLQYTPETLEELKIEELHEVAPHIQDEHDIDWIDIRGLHDTELIQDIGKTFRIHSLILEDIADINQRPKYEEYDHGHFLILHALSFDRENSKISREQVSLYFGKGFMVSFQEAETDLFEGVRQRLRNKHGKIRQKKSDYLCYALADTIVDHYYLVLDEVADDIQEIEDLIMEDNDQNIKQRIHQLKKELIKVKKAVSPLREAINQFSKSEGHVMDQTTVMYLRDLYDHIIHLMEMIETYRDVLHGLQDLYISEISFRMNQVMQILTIITTIFVPLSFLAGIYGMNFTHMPELHYKYGYYILLGIMFSIFVGLLIFFKRKRWF